MRDKQGNPKTLKRVGETKTQSSMKATISFKVWFITIKIDLKEVIKVRLWF